MLKSIAWLQNTFRVGKKIWTSNDAQNSRAIAGIAYALATNRTIGEFDTGMSIYNRKHETSEDIQLMLDGVEHPDFIKIAYAELLKHSHSGIIYNRKFEYRNQYIKLSYGNRNGYRYNNISCQFNTYGPRTFLKEHKLYTYLMDCCCNNPQSRILSIIEMDKGLDIMVEILDSIDDRYNYP